MPRPNPVLAANGIMGKYRGDASVLRMKNVSGGDLRCGEPMRVINTTVAAAELIYDGEAGNFNTPFGHKPVYEYPLDTGAVVNYAPFDKVSWDPVNEVVVPDGTPGSVQLGRALPRHVFGNDTDEIYDWTNNDSAAAAGDECILVMLHDYISPTEA